MWGAQMSKFVEESPDPESLGPSLVTPTDDFLRRINRMKSESQFTYDKVRKAWQAYERAPDNFHDSALELTSHVDQLQVWVTVKGVRLLIRVKDGKRLVDNFVVRDHLAQTTPLKRSLD